jgi:glycosyltransferase involved in cell wall biosynthesis
MKVSIVIPTYKRVDYLERLLLSIQKQTFNKYEVIVVDDHSPNQEEYKSLVEKYQMIFDEFTYLSNSKNSGAPHSRNRGIKIAKYDLIALVDDDDEWCSQKLAHQVNVFESHPETDIVYTWTNAIDEDGKIVYEYKKEIEGNPKYEILKGCFIPSPSVMVKKDAITKSGLFDETLPSCQDWDMWTRMILDGANVRVVKEIDTIYYKHNNGTIGLSPKAYQGFMIYFRKHFFSAMKVNPIISLYYIYQGIRIWWRKKA